MCASCRLISIHVLLLSLFPAWRAPLSGERRNVTAVKRVYGSEGL